MNFSIICISAAYLWSSLQKISSKLLQINSSWACMPLFLEWNLEKYCIIRLQCFLLISWNCCFRQLSSRSFKYSILMWFLSCLFTHYLSNQLLSWDISNASASLFPNLTREKSSLNSDSTPQKLNYSKNWYSHKKDFSLCIIYFSRMKKSNIVFSSNSVTCFSKWELFSILFFHFLFDFSYFLINYFLG